MDERERMKVQSANLMVVALNRMTTFDDGIPKPGASDDRARWAAAIVDAADVALDGEIRRLRLEGRSWSAIGRLIGVSAPAVSQRMKRRDGRSEEHLT